MHSEKVKSLTGGSDGWGFEASSEASSEAIRSFAVARESGSGMPSISGGQIDRVKADETYEADGPLSCL